MELTGQFLIHTEEVAYLTTADTDITGRYVDIRTDDLIQLTHESLAEAHDLRIALATWREVTATLATTHRQGRQRILEGLLETEELQDAQVHGGMEAQTALVRTDGTVELHTVADVHLYLALVVDPGHTEGDDALRFHDALHDFCLLKLRMLVIYVFDRLQYFTYSL